ncbi:MAG: chromosomal replication initiator protein DnaA [Myxococcota bacterium]
MADIWSNALARLSGKISEQNFDLWLRPIECCSIDGNKIVLRAPNPYVQLWFESNYLAIILDELTAATEIEFAVEFAEPGPAVPATLPDGESFSDESPSDEPPSDELIGQPDAVPAATSTASAAGSGPVDAGPAAMVTGPAHREPDHSSPHSPAPAVASPAVASPAVAVAARRATRTVTPPRPVPKIEPSVTVTGTLLKPPEPPEPSANNEHPPPALNPRYTFDTFVSGPSNQLAYAASKAAADAPAPKYNPIFICGGVGLGKTHLLHAIGHCFINKPKLPRILYLSGERFMNEYIHAIRTNQMHQFRTRYREGCDVLLVDDVQFLAGKDGTQDEFFHTFNALYDTQRQIVLTADRKPYEISDIADRLKTRFAWGLMADIEPPELEVRVAILRKKAEAESIHLPDDVALYIASAIKSNVRELEGALIRLAAYASLSQRTIDMNFAQETLGNSLTRPRERLTADAVIRAVASYYGVKVGEIKSARRHKAIAGPRAVAMYLARKHTSDSYPDLGRAFGGKHHTTVISAVDKITKRLKTDPGLRGEVQAIEANLR